MYSILVLFFQKKVEQTESNVSMSDQGEPDTLENIWRNFLLHSDARNYVSERSAGHPHLSDSRLTVRMFRDPISYVTLNAKSASSPEVYHCDFLNEASKMKDGQCQGVN